MNNCRVILIISFFFSSMLFSTPSWSDTSALCPGETGYLYTNYRSTRNPRVGGFVSDSAYVGDYVFIAPTAAVCGSSSVLKSARIYGSAVVSGEAEVTDNARVYGKAKVYGTAYIGGDAKVSDNAQVFGDAVVDGKAWIRGYTKISAGTVSKGAKKSAKPQSVIDQEKRQAAAAAAKQAKANERARLARFKVDGKASLKAVGKLLSRGSYKATNDRRQTVTSYTWTVSELSSDNCKIEMRERSTERGKNSGKKIGKSSSDYKSISMKYPNLRGQNYSYSDGIEPRTCLSNRNEHTFCYSSHSKRSKVVDAINMHTRKYCSN